MTVSIVRTINTVFEQVDVYPTFDANRGDGTGNLVLLAYDGPQRTPDAERMREFPVHPLAEQLQSGAMFRPIQIDSSLPSMVITDDFNPLDVHDAWLREALRRRILDTTHWSLLLGKASHDPVAAAPS